ncbi:MAG: right-handed parallel beta-helix repeat-containing protein [Thermoplasmata archaeon]|nr:MAG: right-handed parallel beta-helix repeat-containing protein [Thermoplasmata archaeon]
MDKKLISFGIACLIVIAGFVGFIRFGTMDVQGTEVSGTVYDGSGGPWTLAGSPYFVVGDVTIPSGETLTIDPGVDVKFNASFSIFVDGNLNAIGTETERINITSNMPSPSNGDWEKIHIRSSGHVDIRYSDIRYGYIGLHIESSSNNIILNCNITENGDTLSTGFGIYLQSSSYNNISNNNIWSNTERGIYMISSSSNNIIKNNNISHNGNPAVESCGLYMESSMNNTITDNNVTGNGETSAVGFGIFIVSSTNNTVTNNRVLSNEGEGIRLISSSYNNISSNDILSHDVYGINLESSPNNTVENNDISDGYYGINLWASENNEINENNFFDISGIYATASSNNNFLSNDASDISLYSSHNNTLLKNNLNSILLDGSSKNNVTDNDVQMGDPYGIRVYSASYNTFSNNNVSNAGDQHDGNGFWLVSASDNIIRENNIKSNKNSGIRTESSFNNRISNNNITFNGQWGILTISSSYNVIENNYLSNNMDGIWVSSSSYNTVVANNVSSNLGKGIEVDGLSNKIMNNDVYLNGLGIKISSFPSASDFNYIAHNNISFHSGRGIVLDSSTTNSTILNNHLTNNYRGVSISSSSDNVICNNNISSSDYSGVLLSSSVNNRIIGNTIFNNQGEGIYIDSSSSSNIIYHNNFIDNVDQADDFGPDNVWDNGYPSGGNYWSNFDEPGEGAYDGYKGPNQDEFIAEGDGIVDQGPPVGGKNPYFIDFVDSQDYYPLIEPHSPMNPIILKQGWNLISLRLIQEEQTLTKVLKSIDGLYDAVQWYNISDKSDPWKHHRVGKPFGNDLFELTETMGFWIHIPQSGDTIFLYNGTQHTENQTITLYPGWNVVGYPSLTSYNRTTGLSNLTFGTHVNAIWTYNAATQKYKRLTESDYFEIGKGYYIHAKSECTWEVPL